MDKFEIDPAIVEAAARAYFEEATGFLWADEPESIRNQYRESIVAALQAVAPLLVKGEREAIERSKLNILEELGRANRVIQKAAMLLGSTDEWTDQGAMIADFEQRFAAAIRERGKA